MGPPKGRSKFAFFEVISPSSSYLFFLNILGSFAEKSQQILREFDRNASKGFFAMEAFLIEFYLTMILPNKEAIMHDSFIGDHP